jgi:uncharacterized peroxidase-related enzyme
MAHITLPLNLFGIVGPLAQYPATGRILSTLTETLLRGPSPLTPAERELIAAFVSFGNECEFCAGSHAAAARALVGTRSSMVDDVLANGDAHVEARLAALLAIADKVRVDGRTVTPADVSAARDAGADDQAIHDTVLIAAAFCMFNRYVDGLATSVPPDPAMYNEMGANLAENGYLAASPASQAI